MCMMTVRYTNENGGETVMENVASIRLQQDGLTLTGLLDGECTLPETRIVEIDFTKSLTLVARGA